MSESTCKKCTKCGGGGPFRKCKKAKDGLNWWCVGCENTYSRSWYHARGKMTPYYYPMNSDTSLRFWRYVDNTPLGECWHWVGNIDSQGYGRMTINSKSYLAHRVMFEYYNGKILYDRLCVLHMCDNPRCVNPSHLRAGSRLDNTRDMYKKGRGNSAKGEKTHAAKLTDRLVLEIRDKHKSTGIGSYRLSKEYGVSKPTIQRVLRRKSWKHV